MHSRPLDQPAYTQAVVCRVTNLPPTTLQNWANRHLIKLSEQNPGKSQKRLYSTLDMVKLLTMQLLTKTGISANMASDFAHEIAVPHARKLYELGSKEDGDILRYKSDLADAIFYLDGENWKYYIDTDKGFALRAMADALRPNLVQLKVKVSQIYFAIGDRLLDIEIEDRKRRLAEKSTETDS